MRFIIASICEVLLFFPGALFGQAIPSLSAFVAFCSFFLFGPIVGILISIIALILSYISISFETSIELWLRRKFDDLEEDRSDDGGGE